MKVRPRTATRLGHRAPPRRHTVPSTKAALARHSRRGSGDPPRDSRPASPRVARLPRGGASRAPPRCGERHRSFWLPSCFPCARPEHKDSRSTCDQAGSRRNARPRCRSGRSAGGIVREWLGLCGRPRWSSRRRLDAATDPGHNWLETKRCHSLGDPGTSRVARLICLSPQHPANQATGKFLPTARGAPTGPLRLSRSWADQPCGILGREKHSGHGH